ncbi:MAG: hypothetical protein J1E16_10475 [Muribaculaceae bacterium]|nr:hypothetical protein [Muribaculaceae bacterium]
MRNHACRNCGRREPRGKLMATDWLADKPIETNQRLVEVIFKNTRVGFFENSENLPLQIGDLVVVEGTPGYDIGRVNMMGHLVNLQMKKSGFKEFTELKSVLRLASEEDLDKFEEARSREHSTMIKARSIAEELGLAMKIGDVEFQGDGSKAIFYYIADERVDFRKLIRILAETFKVRIEMKQIGARQEAGRIGGIGPCGRPLCCSSWMNRFVSVGTGAARLQDLSMNPQKLAGQCGKLKCCLNFEIDSYAEANKDLPPREAHLETKDNIYYLFKTDILGRKLTYSTDKHLPANLVSIEAQRALDIIELNKKGIRPEFLSEELPVDTPSEFGDIIGQDSLTRFDKKGNNRKKKKNKKTNEGSFQNQEEQISHDIDRKQRHFNHNRNHRPHRQNVPFSDNGKNQ